MQCGFKILDSHWSRGYRMRPKNSCYAAAKSPKYVRKTCNDLETCLQTLIKIGTRCGGGKDEMLKTAGLQLWKRKLWRKRVESLIYFQLDPMGYIPKTLLVMKKHLIWSGCSHMKQGKPRRHRAGTLWVLFHGAWNHAPQKGRTVYWMKEWKLRGACAQPPLGSTQPCLAPGRWGRGLSDSHALTVASQTPQILQLPQVLPSSNEKTLLSVCFIKGIHFFHCFIEKAV